MIGNIVDFLAALTAAVIGGLLAGGFALWGVILAHKKELKRRRQEQKETLQSLYQGLYTEVQILWEGYMSGLGGDIDKLKGDEPLDRYYPITPNEFPVYTANLPLIGQIEDSTLRELIIRTYARGKGIIDSTLMNNSLVAKSEQWDWLYAETHKEIHKHGKEAATRSMVDYARNIRQQHQDLVRYVAELLKALKGELDSNEVKGICP
jgi:hypothetical protein